MGVAAGRFVQTHTHNEGGEYEVLANPQVKIEGTWVDGVLYRNKEGRLFVRTLYAFNASFSPYHENPAKKR